MGYTNKDIAEAFRQAKKILWTTREGFICFAITDADYDGRNPEAVSAAKKVIEERLGKFYSLRGWLLARDVLREDIKDPPRMQAHRHAWLDLLIEEFENKED